MTLKEVKEEIELKGFCEFYYILMDSFEQMRNLHLEISEMGDKKGRGRKYKATERINV